MKTDTREVVTRTNQPGRESIKMSFDEDGAAHLARLVTDLYADPASACLREYPANGLDSHVLAGQTRAVEVTLPTSFNPTLLVQDWGVGMSKADIIDIYSKYGASTKRDSNTQIGAFGLGCKSALSMTPSFVLTAVKNNRKIVAIIHRGSDGVGNIEFVNEMETHEGNGVTVSIPVTDSVKDYAAKARAIFVTWPKGSILVDGKVPDLSITSEDDFLPLGDSAFISRNQAVDSNNYRVNGSMIVNMGGIGYLVDREQANKMLATASTANVTNLTSNVLSSVRHTLAYNMTLVINVGLGDVDLVPSRESVRWTHKSTDAVQKNIYSAISSIPEALAKDFKDCKTHAEVLTKETATFAKNFQDIYSTVKWGEEFLPGNVSFHYANTNNYEDDGVTDYTISYSGDERVPVRRDSNSMKFDFGFSNRSDRSFKLNVPINTSSAKQYVFVKVEGAEEFRKKVSGYFNSYLAHQRGVLGVAYGSTVVVGYENDIFENPWLDAVFNAPVKNIAMSKVDVDEIVELAKEYRKSTRTYTSSGALVPAVRTAVLYDTWVMDKNGKMSSKAMPATEIDELAAENGYTVYLDNMKFIDSSGYDPSWNRMASFMPHGSMVVSVGAGRKFEALQKRITSDVSETLLEDLTLGYNACISEITAKTFFSTRNGNLTSSLSSIRGRVEELKDGFIKSIMDGSSTNAEIDEKITNAINIGNGSYLKLNDENKNWTEKFNEIADKVMQKFPMVWHSNRSYQTSADNYAESVIDYLNFKHEAIEEMFADFK